jgi:hypothetical protein
MFGMKSFLNFVSWLFLFLGFIGVSFVFIGELSYVVPGSVLAGSALIAFTLRQ